MPLLVVVLGAEEAEQLTLGEWDRLLRCEQVLFERPDHPMATRLEAAGIEVGRVDREPDPHREGSAVVCEPGSRRPIELGRRGASLSVAGRDVPDDLTAAYGAYAARRAAGAFGRLVSIMARLRSPDGCPWDREQDHRTLTVHLQEEAHEVIDAIESGALGRELEDELGDLLLQVLFHAQMAADDGRFDIVGVVDAIATKLIHRHPHVFADVSVADAGEVLRNWETLKAVERDGREESAIPPGLPALLTASKVQKRAAGAGVSIDAGEARDKARRALEEDPGEDSIGEALFWAVALARSARVDPEGALRRATRRFGASF